MKTFKQLERIFFDYEEQKRKKVRDEHLDSSSYTFMPSRAILPQKSSAFSKQVVIKLLSNLSSNGVKNALSYVIRNSAFDFAFNESHQPIRIDEILRQWQKDFSTQPNAKEAWHFTFCLDELKSECNIKALQDSVKEVMQTHFYGYKYVSVLHTHQHKPHIHIILNKTNIFTHKKLHFNNKQEIKDFWNLLREDFKNALNFHNPNFNYKNSYRYERNLLKESAKASIEIPLNIAENIAKQIAALESKIQLYETKSHNLTKTIFQHMQEKRKLINELKLLIQSGNKCYFQLLNSIKATNKELCSLRQSNKGYQTQKKQLQEQIRKLREQRLYYKSSYDGLAKKQAYAEFLRTKKQTKADIFVLRQIQSEIALNEKNLAKNTESQINADLIMARTLHKKSNAFVMIGIAKDLDSHLKALAHIEISDSVRETLQDYETKLLENKAFVLKMCQQKVMILQEYLKGKKSPYKLKELNALCNFLGLENQTQTQEPSKTRSSTHTQELLSNELIDVFLRWYCKKQHITNPAIYEAHLREKIHNGTFENFKEQYRAFIEENKAIKKL